MAQLALRTHRGMRPCRKRPVGIIVFISDVESRIRESEWGKEKERKKRKIGRYPESRIDFWMLNTSIVHTRPGYSYLPSQWLVSWFGLCEVVSDQRFVTIAVTFLRYCPSVHGKKKRNQIERKKSESKILWVAQKWASEKLPKNPDSCVRKRGKNPRNVMASFPELDSLPQKVWLFGVGAISQFMAATGSIFCPNVKMREKVEAVV